VSALLRPKFHPESLLRSLMENVPGAVYRCANDADWTMLGIGDCIETISAYPATDFIASSVRSPPRVIQLRASRCGRSPLRDCACWGCAAGRDAPTVVNWIVGK